MRTTKDPTTALERLTHATPNDWLVTKKRGGYVVKVRGAQFSPRPSASALAVLADLAMQPEIMGGLGWTVRELRAKIRWAPRVTPTRRISQYESDTLYKIEEAA